MCRGDPVRDPERRPGAGRRTIGDCVVSEPTPADGPGPSPTLVARIDEACDRFEAAWKAGPPPRLEDYLDAAPVPERPALLRPLRAVELDYRRRRGERPSASEYRGRFPGLEAAVDAS